MGSEFTTALIGIFPRLIPEMILVGMSAVIFLGGAFSTRRHLWNVVSLITILLAMLVVIVQGGFGPAPGGAALFAAPVVFDSLAYFL
jgi:hypothetical protein